MESKTFDLTPIDPIADMLQELSFSIKQLKEVVSKIHVPEIVAAK